LMLADWLRVQLQSCPIVKGLSIRPQYYSSTSPIA